MRRLAAGGLALTALLSGSAARAADAPLLSAEQQAWLAQRVVRFGPERDYGPFVFQRDDGQVDGLSVDMLRLLEQRTGLRLQWHGAAPLATLLDDARARRVDLLSSLRPTAERARFLEFSLPYVAVPALLVQRTADAPLTLAQLAGRPVAVGQGYAVEAVMRQRHPQVQWQAVSDDAVALQGLVAGRFDAVVADSASVAFISRRQGLSGLRAEQEVGFDYPLSFAVRSDWPELTAILNRGIQSLSVAERQAVLARWLPPRQSAAPRSPLATRLGLGLLALTLLLGTLYWWRRRRGPA